MRRKPGALLPIEEAILHAAVRLWRTGSAEFHGYEIARHVADQFERRSLTAYGTLYRALSRLETMGLLESRFIEGDQGLWPIAPQTDVMEHDSS